MPSNRKQSWGIAVLALAVLAVCGVPLRDIFTIPITSAQSVTLSETFINGATHTVSFLNLIFGFLSWLVLSILHVVMDPQFIFATNANEEGSLLLMLREVWQFTRDLVNIGFAIGLIVGAVMMIVTADGSKIKERIPAFVMAVVLVNLSWFIPRAIFDFSQVLTYTIYQIPSLLGADRCELPPGPNDANPRPCEAVIGFRFLDEARRLTPVGGGQYTDPQDNSTGWSCPIPQLICIRKVRLDSPEADTVPTHTRILDGLIVNHARLQWLTQLNFNTAIAPTVTASSALYKVIGAVAKLVVLLIINVAILFPLMAMTAAFFIRIPVLWVSMAFMPLVALAYAFPKLKDGEYKELFFDWQTHFLQAVFLPAKVAIPFAISFILLNAGSQTTPPPGFGQLPNIPVFMGVRDLWQFVWMLIALFILWKYSFEQLKPEKAGIAGAFTETIKGIGTSALNVAKLAPMSIPFIPVPTRDAEGNVTLQRRSVAQVLHQFDPRTIEQRLQNIARFQPQQTNREQGVIEAFRKLPQNTPTIINIRNTVTAATIDEKQFTQHIEEFVKAFPRESRGLTEQRILELLQQANLLPVSPDQQKQLQQFFKTRGARVPNP